MYYVGTDRLGNQTVRYVDTYYLPEWLTPYGGRIWPCQNKRFQNVQDPVGTFGSSPNITFTNVLVQTDAP